MNFDECCSCRDGWRLAMMMMVDDGVAGRSQWSPVVGLRSICQVSGVKRLSERVAKARRRDKVGTF